MKRVIKKADDDRASAIIFDLNTPGGIAWYTEEIMLADLQQISIPTYSFVNPKAMSAGALIAIATDRIYMHPPSTIGAAAPVMGGGQEIPETMLKKVMGDILSTADDVARRKGHNPDIAKAFIDTKIELSFDLPFVSTEGALERRDGGAGNSAATPLHFGAPPKFDRSGKPVRKPRAPDHRKLGIRGLGPGRGFNRAGLVKLTFLPDPGCS